MSRGALARNLEALGHVGAETFTLNELLVSVFRLRVRRLTFTRVGERPACWAPAHEQPAITHLRPVLIASVDGRLFFAGELAGRRHHRVRCLRIRAPSRGRDAGTVGRCAGASELIEGRLIDGPSDDLDVYLEFQFVRRAVPFDFGDVGAFPNRE